MKTKTLILTSEFPPLPGGIGNHAFYLSKYLQQSGYEVTVLSDFRNTSEDVVFDEKQNFKIVRIKRNAVTYFNRVLKGYSLAKKSETIIASGKFSLWLGALFSLVFPKKKYVVVLHGSELKAGGGIGQLLTKWGLSRYDKLIAVSKFTKSKVLEINPKLSVNVINNGIESGRFRKENKHHSQNINLITVGNLTHRKGQQNVIKALPQLKESLPNIHYHCVGIPTEKEILKKLTDSMGVANAVTFHGPLSEVQKIELLQTGTVFMMLSEQKANDFEGFGIAILEANALGIPAIGSKKSGIEDAIKDGYSGKLVDPHNVQEIVSALNDVLENYKTYSDHAVEWSSRFNWKIIITKYIEAIET